MSTTKNKKEQTPITKNEFRMIGARLRAVRFEEESFLSLFENRADDTATPQSMQLTVQVSVGQAEFSRYPPKDSLVLEIPLDFFVIAEDDHGGSDRKILTISFFGGFVPSLEANETTLKSSFDEVKNKFATILYYAVRSEVRRIVELTVLRDVRLPWDMQFEELKSKRKAGTGQANARTSRAQSSSRST